MADLNEVQEKELREKEYTNYSTPEEMKGISNDTLIQRVEREKTSVFDSFMNMELNTALKDPVAIQYMNDISKFKKNRGEYGFMQPLEAEKVDFAAPKAIARSAINLAGQTKIAGQRIWDETKQEWKQGTAELKEAKTALESGDIAGYQEMIKNLGKNVDYSPVEKQNVKMQEDLSKFIGGLGLERTGQEGFGSDILEGGVSLGAALGISFATKNPYAAGAMFGLWGKENIQQELQRAGVNYETARKWGYLGGAVEGGLEYWGIDRLVKGMKGNSLIKRAANGYTTEAIQEASQEGGSEVILSLAGVEKEAVEIIGNTMYSGNLGGLLGSGATSIGGIGMQDVKDGIDKLSGLGMKREHAEIVVNKSIEKFGNSQEVVNEVGNMIKRENSNLTYQGSNVKNAQEYFKKAFEDMQTNPELMAGMFDIKDAVVKKVLDSGGKKEEAIAIAAQAQARAVMLFKEEGVTPKEYLEDYIPTIKNEATINEDGELVIDGQVMFQDKAPSERYTFKMLSAPEFVNKQNIKIPTITGYMGRKDVKGIERTLLQTVLDNHKGEETIDKDVFAKEIKEMALPLDRIDSSTYADYGMERTGVSGYGSTNIYNSPLDHGITGHFTTDFYNINKSTIEDNIDSQQKKIDEISPLLEMSNEELRNVAESGQYHSIAEYRGVLENDLSLAKKNLVQFQSKLGKAGGMGLFGHTRTWDSGDTRYLAEIQSDSYQKKNAKQMVVDSILENPKGERQKKIVIDLESLNSEMKDLSNTYFEVDSYLNGGVQNISLSNAFTDLSSMYKKDKDYTYPSGKKPQDFINEYESSMKKQKVWKKYERFFKAKQEISKLRKELEKTFTIQDKQFIAHKNNYEERMLREEIARAAQEGKTNIAIPSLYTLAKIEGYIDEDGGTPYEYDGDRDTELEVGDKIDFGGEDWTVLTADSTDITVGQGELLFYVDDIDGYITEEVIRRLDGVFDNMNDEIVEKDIATNYVPFDDDGEITSSLFEEFGKEKEIDGKTVTVMQRDDFQEKYTDIVMENAEERGISDLVEEGGGYWYENYTGDAGVIDLEGSANTQTLMQPNQYQTVSSEEDFDVEEHISEDYQPIMERYEELIEKFKELRPDATLMEDTGEGWWTTALTEKDANSPVVLFQEKRGMYDPTTNVITLLENADETTRLHEFTHPFMLDMQRINRAKLAKDGVEFAPFRELVEVAGEPVNGQFTREQNEIVVRGLEQFVRTGKVSNPKLRKVIEKLAEWFRAIYKSAKDLGVVLSERSEKFYDDMFSTPYLDEDSFAQDAVQRAREINEKLEKGEKVTPEEINKIKEIRNFLKQKRAKMPKDFISYVKFKGGINLDAGKQLDIDNFSGLKDTVAYRGVLQKKSQNNERDLEQWVKEFTGREVDSQEALDFLREAADSPKYMDAEGGSDLVAEIESLTNNIEQTLIETGIDLNTIDDKIKQAEKFMKRQRTESIKQQKAILKLTPKNFPKFIAENIDRIQKSDMTADQKNNYERKLTNAEDQLEVDFILREINEEVYKAGARSVKSDLNVLIQKGLRKSKPVKQGQRTVGKYDYATNEIFDALREYNRLSRDEAYKRIPTFSETQTEGEENSIAEDILARFLTYKAKGQRGSIGLYKQVAEDMNYLNAKGKQAKSDEEFEDMINMKNHIDKALVGISKIKGDPETVKTKSANALLSATGNLESYMVAGLANDFMEDYTLLLNEADEFIAVQKSINDIISRGKLVYGLKEDNDFLKYIEDLGIKTDLKLKKTKGKTQGRKLSKLEMMDIYNAIKDPVIKEDYNRVYDLDQVRNILTNLSDADKLFSNQMMDVLKNYYEDVNDVFIELFNRDMPRNPNYWTSSGENQSIEDVFQTFISESKLPEFTKHRARTRSPYPVNAFTKVIKYVNNAEYMKNVSLKYRELERIFKDTDVKEGLVEKRGDSYYQGLIRTLKNSSIKQVRRDMDATEKVADLLLGNWITAKIGMNPDVFLKQLISSVNYAEQMPSNEWVNGLMEGLSNPKETFDMMWNLIPYLEARFQKGYSEALQAAMNGVNQMPKGKSKLDDFKTFLTWTTRAGDIGAIIYGGFPLVQYYKKQGMSDKEIAEQFVKVTLRSQQSPMKSSLSSWQNAKDPVRRMLFAFANTPSQYARKIYEATMSYQNGDITKEQLAKVFVIYGVINGVVYSLEGAMMAMLLSGGDEPIDSDDIKQAVIQVGLTPLGGIPLMKDALNTLARASMGLKTYELQVPMLDDLMDIAKDLGTGDYIDVLKTGTELGTGTPVKKYLKYYDKINRD